MIFSIATVVLSTLAAVSAQKTINVNVGDGGLTYTPNNIQASVGDTVVFNFIAKNHTVTQSTFGKPCEVMTSPMQGIDSGFVPVDPNSNQIPTWSFEINNASVPLWFFCRQTNHCQSGMVFAINAPSSGNTFDAYLNNAKNTPMVGSSSSMSMSSSSMSSSSMTSSGFVTSTSATATSTGSSSMTGSMSSTSSTASATSSGSAGKLSSSVGLVGVVALIAGAMF